MKNNKGFTLIELLAVIIILSIIMVMIVPTVNNLINDSKKRLLKVSALGLARTAQQQYIDLMTNNKNNFIIFNYKDGIETSSQPDASLNFTGKRPKNGKVIINKDGQIKVVLHDDKFCAIKDFNESEVTLSENNADDCINKLGQTTIEIIDVKIEDVLSSGPVIFENYLQFPGKADLIEGKNYIVSLTKADGEIINLYNLGVTNVELTNYFNSEEKYGVYINTISYNETMADDPYTHYSDYIYTNTKIITDTYIPVILKYLNEEKAKPTPNELTILTLQKTLTTFQNFQKYEGESWIFGMTESSQTNNIGLKEIKIEREL